MAFSYGCVSWDSKRVGNTHHQKVAGTEIVSCVVSTGLNCTRSWYKLLRECTLEYVINHQSQLVKSNLYVYTEPKL